MQNKMTLKVGTVIVCDDLGIGEITDICENEISSYFIDREDQTLTASFSEGQEWYEENCRIAAAEDAEWFSGYLRHCEELLREAEEYGDLFDYELDWQLTVDGYFLKEGDHLLRGRYFGTVNEIRQNNNVEVDNRNIANFCNEMNVHRYLVSYRDLDDLDRCAMGLESINYLSKNCRYLTPEEAEPYLKRINAYDAALDENVCGALEYYEADGYMDWDFYDDLDDYDIDDYLTSDEIRETISTSDLPGIRKTS
ncbi:MAG: hypothetical protein J1F11_08875 [Oscillospiraceae bacterium]|nr:hypothetical protein [Oscillospiraceae bacterium]